MELPLPPTNIARIAFLGTPAAAVPTLRDLIGAGYEIPVVVSTPNKRRGRGSNTTPSAVKAAALEFGCEVVTDMAAIEDHDVDLGVVVAFGRIIPGQILERLPIVNIHFSDLPRWRGAAPVERAILAGDTETAVCVMAVAEGLDEGDVWARASVEIEEGENAAELTMRMSHLGSDLLLSTLTSGFTDAIAQVGEVTYASKISNEDRHLHWTDSATQLHRIVRSGGAWTTFRGKRFKVWKSHVSDIGPRPGHLTDLVVGTAAGGLELVTVQPEGKPQMTATDWVNGARPERDEVLGGS